VGGQKETVRETADYADGEDLIRPVLKFPVNREDLKPILNFKGDNAV
jgi:hypothetical protein